MKGSQGWCEEMRSADLSFWAQGDLSQGGGVYEDMPRQPMSLGAAASSAGIQHVRREFQALVQASTRLQDEAHAAGRPGSLSSPAVQGYLVA